jgi:hypothetical protein
MKNSLEKEDEILQSSWWIQSMLLLALIT